MITDIQLKELGRRLKNLADDLNCEMERKRLKELARRLKNVADNLEDEMERNRRWQKIIDLIIEVSKIPSYSSILCATAVFTYCSTVQY